MTANPLLEKWRTRSEHMREYGAHPQADVLHACARELEEYLTAQDEELLTLARASELGGYSQDHLGRLIREGKIRNAGRPGAPRIARGDLPTKPGAFAPVAHLRLESDNSFEQIVQSIVDEGVA